MNRLLTVDGEVLSGTPWQTYPRPQLKRDSYLCLNGEWEFATGSEAPAVFPDVIRVPFAPQSI